MTTDNLQVETLTTTARDGMGLVVMLAVWQGRVIEVMIYRASDMAQLENKSLSNGKGGVI